MPEGPGGTESDQGTQEEEARTSLPETNAHSRESEGRLRKQNAVLTDLARRKTYHSSDLEMAVKEITEAAAHTLEIERVSVWLYNRERSRIRCLDLYERSADRHSEGLELAAEDYPEYFRELERSRIIAAHEAQTDPRIRELTEAYFKPLGITSLIDAPIRLGGQTIGIIRHAHVGVARQWASDEQQFVGSMADLISLAMEARERQQAEAALRESEERYRALVTASAQVVWRCDEEGEAVFTTSAWQELTGQHEEEMKGWGWLNAIHPDDRAQTAQTWVQAVKTKTLYENEFRVQVGYESYRDFQLRGVPVYAADGSVREWVGTITDITERKRAEQILRESEDRYRELFENANDIHYTHDLSGNYTTVNKAGERITGYTRDELLRMNVSHLVASEHLELARRMVADKLAGANPTVYEIEIVAKNGRRVLLEVSSRLIYEKGKPVGVQGMARDITERWAAQEALRESEERYALAALGANDGLWDWDLKNHHVYFSPRWKSMLGYEEDEIANRPEEWFDRIHPDDLLKVKEEINAHLAGRTVHFENEHRMRHKSGTYRWMLARGIAVRDALGVVSRIAGSQTDITRRKQVEEQLTHDAFHDALTGLPNRALFMEHLSLVIEQSTRREDYLFAVLFLDVDQFKIVNDSLGHIIGDQLLIEISQRLKKCLRPGDMVARLGGDEFTILLQDMNESTDAIRLAERLHREFMLPFNAGGNEVFTTASIGIVLNATGFDRPEDFLRAADTAMYRAKASGRARHEVFDQDMHDRVMMLLQLETDLRRAIERQEMRVHYQPIVSLATSRITGFEALARWQHPDRGLVFPVNFIPLAEETGLIIPIGMWVLEEACRQIRDWQARFCAAEPLCINVNLSSKQFTQPNLIDGIANILRETNLDARCLRLEITESVVMEHAESTAVMLKQLREIGVQLTIDDFGTGYSSLSYLQRFPIDSLKVDRSFVSRMGDGNENSEIVRTIIALARNLGMDVVAEGVETREQLAQLRKLNCDYGQGYFFSKAVSGEAAETLLAAKPNQLSA